MSQPISKLDPLTTEQSNPASESIDSLSTLDMVRLMNEEDRCIADAVSGQSENIATAIEVISARLKEGGRLIYMGAGTSGRLGVLDASECPPTFNTSPDQVVGLIAGGSDALTRAIEGAEDHPETGEKDLLEIGLCDNDVVVGIASSGSTPFVIGGMKYANKMRAFTIALTCNRETELETVTQLAIVPVVGPEVISGSTRLKAGTATKMVLNMLTTGSMIRLGKTFGNLMVDLRATNQKLTHRSKRIVSRLTGLDLDQANRLLEKCDGEVKTSIVAHRLSVAPQKARDLISTADGHLKDVLDKGEAQR